MTDPAPEVTPPTEAEGEEEVAHQHGKSLARRRVDKEWLKLNAQVGETVNEWSKRRDLVAYVAKDGGRGLAAALYDPEKSEIEVNTAEAFGEHVEPHHVGDFTKRKTHFEWPKAAGLVQHEASHARWSTVSLRVVHDQADEDKKNQQSEAYQLLDESRIEANAVRAMPKNKAFLRASALSLVSMDEETKAKMMAMNPAELATRMTLLGHARVDGGVLDRADMKDVRKLTDKIIPKDIYKDMRKLWIEFQDSDDRFQFDRMMQIAKEMAELIAKIHEQNGSKSQAQKKDEFQKAVKEGKFQPGPGEPGEDGEPGQGGGELSEEEQQMVQDLLDALGQAQSQSENNAADEAQDQKKIEDYQEKASKQRDENTERLKNKKSAQDTFNRSQGPYGTRSNSELEKQREATEKERVAANKIGQAMNKAKYRDRVVSNHSSTLPPGRLRVGQAMQGQAAKRNGGVDNTEPWHRTMRKHTDDPKLTLGLMCDISGSMGGSMEAMAVAAWVMSDAVRRIQGRAAAVYYGEDVFPVLKPGEHLKKVSQYTAADGTEAFDKAFRSLDGALDLLHGSGARILVICSDGQYRPAEEEACKKWLKKCKREGVAVVWLGIKGSWGNLAPDICKKTGAHYVDIGKDVISATTAIGNACTKALTEAGLTRVG